MQGSLTSALQSSKNGSLVETASHQPGQDCRGIVGKAHTHYICVIDCCCRSVSLAAGTRTAYPAESTVELGYPEAKWACEELLLSLEGKVCAWDERGEVAFEGNEKVWHGWTKHLKGRSHWGKMSGMTLFKSICTTAPRNITLDAMIHKTCKSYASAEKGIEREGKTH